LKLNTLYIDMLQAHDYITRLNYRFHGDFILNIYLFSLW